MRYLVRLSVPRAGGWRAFGIVRDEFGKRRGRPPRGGRGPPGRDYVRVVIVATVDAVGVTEALDLAWWTFQKARGATSPNGALADAEAGVRPEGR